jgi:hypothetical protein
VAITLLIRPFSSLSLYGILRTVLDENGAVLAENGAVLGENRPVLAENGAVLAENGDGEDPMIISWRGLDDSVVNVEPEEQ